MSSTSTSFLLLCRSQNVERIWNEISIFVNSKKCLQLQLINAGEIQSVCVVWVRDVCVVYCCTLLQSKSQFCDSFEQKCVDHRLKLSWSLPYVRAARFFSAPSLLWFCRLFAVNCQCLFYFVFSVCARELVLSIFISVPIYKTIICICHTEPVCILYNARSISGDLNYRNYLNARHICVVVVVQIIE